ncbi:VOC family protein [Streptomyces sp. Z26]|uniref:VOC family protein n=1 Tax=Streptomyces TaxID=1883 RepID=UPI000EF16FAD|nr:VOC family protein [Streptomyces sp. Z26]RLL67688.1 VOC family protein [Streptomyces sp. Z26]
MIDHMSLQVRDPRAVGAFYDAVLAPLGGSRVREFGPVVGYGVGDRPTFWIGPAGADGAPRETHVAFTAADRAAVVAFHEAATAAGAETLHAPALHPEYHACYFAAFVRDPEGNNVEAVCHLPD